MLSHNWKINVIKQVSESVLTENKFLVKVVNQLKTRIKKLNQTSCAIDISFTEEDKYILFSF